MFAISTNQCQFSVDDNEWKEEATDNSGKEGGKLSLRVPIATLSSARPHAKLWRGITSDRFMIQYDVSHKVNIIKVFLEQEPTLQFPEIAPRHNHTKVVSQIIEINLLSHDDIAMDDDSQIPVHKTSHCILIPNDSALVTVIACFVKSRHSVYIRMLLEHKVKEKSKIEHVPLKTAAANWLPDFLKTVAAKVQTLILNGIAAEMTINANDCASVLIPGNKNHRKRHKLSTLYLIVHCLCITTAVTLSCITILALSNNAAQNKHDSLPAQAIIQSPEHSTKVVGGMDTPAEKGVSSPRHLRSAEQLGIPADLQWLFHPRPTSQSTTIQCYPVGFLPAGGASVSKDSMVHTGCRLASLSLLPATCNVSRIRLAEAGFYYDSSKTARDASNAHEVVCYSCGVTYGRWSASYNPVAIHRRLNPDCNHVKSLAQKDVCAAPSTSSAYSSSPSPSSSSASSSSAASRPGEQAASVTSPASPSVWDSTYWTSATTCLSPSGPQSSTTLQANRNQNHSNTAQSTSGALLHAEGGTRSSQGPEAQRQPVPAAEALHDGVGGFASTARYVG
jgi:hypothetical protein